ncbi:hypothetical protein [Tuwongella immobilis]|uniref:hypothetical protein n=1 Tax=Tuwongella immobilis TaxID=692036 RepID=UPI0013A6B94E|nr:hypothetical protein [Tuwongella immobilis]
MTSETVYRHDDDTGTITTQDDYNWAAGSYQPTASTVSYPAINSSHNGSASVLRESALYDSEGRTSMSTSPFCGVATIRL